MMSDAAPPPRMRRATMADADALLAWRNDAVTRRMSLQTDEVPRERHVRWLERVLADPTRLLLIAEDPTDGAALGMCRFDIDPARADSAEVSINVAPERRGRGVGAGLLVAGIEEFAAAHPEVAHITAVIRATNAASVRLFEALGFRQVGGQAELLHYER